MIKSDTFRPNCPYYFEYKGKDTYLPDKCLLDCTDDLTCIERCFWQACESCAPKQYMLLMVDSPDRAVQGEVCRKRDS